MPSSQPVIRMKGICSGQIITALLCFLLGLLTAVFVLTIFSGTGQGATLYVDDDGGADYTTINHAMENATDGDTIMIHPGDYEETMEVNKELTFQSTTGNPEDVVVHKAGGYSIFAVYSNNVTISGLTVKYGTYMIFLHSSDNCLIENNIITQGATGILLDGNFEDSASNNTIRGNNITGIIQRGAQIGSEAGYNVIENNMFHDCGDGLWIYFTGFETVSNNTILNCDGQGLMIHQSNFCEVTNNIIEGTTWTGLAMSYSSYNTLRENTISGSYFNIDFFGTAIPDFEHDIDDSNTVDGRPIYYWVDESNRTIPLDAGFVGVIKSENITVKDLTLDHNGESVLFVSTVHSLIQEVNISFSDYGIHLFFSDNNTIDGGTVWENDKAGVYVKDSRHTTINGIDASDGGYNLCDGIYIWDSDYTTVITCRVNDNWGTGIQVIYSSYCTVSMNEVRENRKSGIRLVTGNFNRVENNTASDNGDNGIYLGSSPKWNHIANNTCSGNGDNMNEAGINFDSGSGNTAIHNNVSNNKVSGFYFNYGSGNLVTENNVQFNIARAGFFLSRFAEGNTITHNNVSNNLKGFELIQAQGNIIDNNSIFNSGLNGILITYGGDENTITSNLIVNTSDSHGIHLKDMCEDNVIFNNYLHNEMNAFDDGTNFWNTSKQAGISIVDGPFLGGNFWGDHNGVDADKDWLGDDPFDIEGGDNQDIHPLMLRPVLKANFEWDPVNPLNDLEIQFTDASIEAEYEITNWWWDFDDETISVDEDPVHTYSEAGTYEVELRVRDSDGAEAQVTKTVFVKLSGPLFAHNINTGERYQSIQEAINDTDTKEGDIIEIDPGTYLENVIVGKGVIIISSSGDYNDTIIMPAYWRNPVFSVIANNVTIAGLTITRGDMIRGYEVGIMLNHSDECEISYNYIRDHGAGLIVRGCRNTTIEGNQFNNNSNYGILMYADVMNPSEDNVIKNNEIVGAGSTPIWEGIGIAVENSDFCGIIDNTLVGLDTGLWLKYGSDGNTIHSNEISFCLNNGMTIGMSESWYPGNNFNQFTENTIRHIFEYPFFSESNSTGNGIELLTIGTLYETTISFTYNGSIAIKSQNIDLAHPHPHKEVLGSFVNVQGMTDDTWVYLKIHYVDDAVQHLNESSIEINGYWLPHTPTPWYEISEDNGINMDEDFVWVNFSGFSDIHQEIFWLYGVVGDGLYDLDFGDSGYVSIDFGGTGDVNLDVESAMNPGPGDDDSLDIFINITIDGPGSLDWLNITIDVSDNSFVGEGDDLLIYYWNETGQAWTLAEKTGYDAERGVVWANITHLTIFAPRKIEPDTTPPVIVHDPETNASIGEDFWGHLTFIVEATITDDRGVTDVRMYYRKAGEDNWTERKIWPRINNEYTWTTSFTKLNEVDIEYYIWATDGTNEVTYPEQPGETLLINGALEQKEDDKDGILVELVVGVIIVILVVAIVAMMKMEMSRHARAEGTTADEERKETMMKDADPDDKRNDETNDGGGTGGEPPEEMGEN